MSKNEADFLRRLLIALNEPDPWIEVGRPAGISMRLVRAFESEGLITTEGRAVRQVWARLQRGNEIRAHLQEGS